MKLEKFKTESSKKKAMIIGSIGLVLLLTIVIIYRSFAFFESSQEFNVIKGSVPDQNYDVMLSLIKEDENGNKIAIDKIPEKSEEKKYEISITCNNGSSGIWNYDEWKPEMSNYTTTRTKCNIHFKENNEFVYPVSGKGLIAAALTEKGIEASSEDTFESLAEKIQNYKGVTDFSDVSIVASKVMGVWTYNASISYTATEDCIVIAMVNTGDTTGTSGTINVNISSGTMIYNNYVKAGANISTPTIIKKISLKKGENVTASASSGNAFSGHLVMIKI